MRHCATGSRLASNVASLVDALLVLVVVDAQQIHHSDRIRLHEIAAGAVGDPARVRVAGRHQGLDDSVDQLGMALGEITEVVKNATYKGDTLKFWNSLSAVGDPSTWQTVFVENCGKGQPNQVMQLGHGIPVCRFDDVRIGE